MKSLSIFLDGEGRFVVGYTFLSQEWVDEAQRTVEENPEIESRIRDITERVRFVATDCPGQKDVLIDMDIRRGKVYSITREEKPAPSVFRRLPFDKRRYFAAVTTSYRNAHRTIAGETISDSVLSSVPGILKTLMSRDYHIDGSKIAIARLIVRKRDAVRLIRRTWNAIPTEV